MFLDVESISSLTGHSVRDMMLVFPVTYMSCEVENLNTVFIIH